MRKLLQELAECGRMMKLAEGAGVPLHPAHVNPNAQIKPPVTEPSNPGTKTTTASPAVNPPASPASQPNSTSAPAASTSPYQHGFIAATHAAEAGNTVTMVQRPDGTVDLQLLDTHGNPQSLRLDRQAQYLRRADWNVHPPKYVPALDGTTYKFYVSPYGITREAVRDGNSTWTQMDPRTGQMRDPDIHFRYPAPEGANTNSMLLQASAPIPKDILMDGSPSLEVRQYWDSSDNTLRYAYYDPATADILPAESGDVEQLRNILVSSPDTRYYELPPHSDGSIEYVYETADGSYARVRGTDGKDKWYRYRQADDPRNRGYFPDEGVPEGLDPAPSPLKPVTVSEDKPAENPSETSADTEKARRAAYIKEHGEKPEWTKKTPAESIWSDPTFQSNALTGLGVGLLGGLGGYALTGGQGGLAPWLMLGGGVGAGIGGLSGYNQWNANKTEYEDIRKKQKAWDAGLAAGTPVGMLENGTPVTREDLDTGRVRVLRASEDGPVYEVVEQGLKGISVPGKTGTRVDDKGGVWTEDGQERLPAEKDFAAKATYDKTPFIGTGVGQLGGEMQNGQMRYYGFVKPYPSAGNPLARDHHAYWVTDETRPLGGYIVYAYPKGELTNNPADYHWYKEGGGYWNLQKPMELAEVADLVANTSLDSNQVHLLDRSAAAKERLKQHANSRIFSTWCLSDNESGGYDPYGDGRSAIIYTPDNSGE